MTQIDDFGNDVTAMADVGASLVFGTVCADGAPRAARAWSVSVDRASRRLRIAVTADDAGVVANLDNGSVTFTAANVRTFRSVQMKGEVVTVEPATPADRALIDEQTGRFFEAVMDVDHTPLRGLRCLLPHDVVMVEMSVDEQFDQTPGPTAGNTLQASA